MKVLGLAALLTVLLSTVAIAEEKAPTSQLDQAMTTKEIVYYEMKPDFTTTLSGRGANGKLHYLRVSVILMLKDNSLTEDVRDRDPLVRDAIITTIGAKHYRQLITPEGREVLRAECRQKVSELLELKLGRPVVGDLLFTNYLYQ